MLETDVHSSPPADSKDSSHSLSEDLVDEDDWVIVKKQKINILIPPTSEALPTSPRKSTINTSPKVARKKSGKKRRAKLTLGKRKRSSQTSTTAKKTEAGGNGISSKSQDTDHDIVVPISNLATNEDSQNGDGINLRADSGSPIKELVACETSVFENGTRISSRDIVPNHTIIAHFENLKAPTLAHIFSDGVRSRVHRKPKTDGRERRSLPIGAFNVVNQRLRARNLEKKLKALGGLRSWLVSQGLDQFVNIFEKAKVGNYQLSNISMSKLKDMGTHAVGPRRKLIHGIDLLCQPYYTKIDEYMQALKQ